MAATSIGSSITGFGDSFIPSLGDAANIQTALKSLYFGTTGAANTSNGIYGALYTLYAGNPTLAGDVTITGNLTVNGTTTVKLTSTANVVASPAGGEIEYNGIIITAIPNTNLGRVAIATPIFTSGANASFSGTQTATNGVSYPLFPTTNDTLTLPVGTYRVETAIRITSTITTTTASLNLDIRGSGAAVGTMTWDGTYATSNNGGTTTTYFSDNTALGTTITLTATETSTGRIRTIRGSGILKITTAGTIVPSFRFVGNNSTNVSVNADNYMVITPLASTSTTSTGNWS